MWWPLSRPLQVTFPSRVGDTHTAVEVDCSHSDNRTLRATEHNHCVCEAAPHSVRPDSRQLLLLANSLPAQAAASLQQQRTIPNDEVHVW